jgi:exodeoxyribonuclease-3
MRTILSWNVNGLRQRHNLNEFLPVFHHNPDIVCIQETKTPREKVPDEIKKLHGYHVFCAPVSRDSFTEVMLFTRSKPLSVRYGFGSSSIDEEGRIIVADFGTFVLLNIYAPLGISPVDTMEHKLAFFDAFLACARRINEAGRPVIICGDFSIAYSDNDVERIKKYTARQVGSTPAEREKIDALVSMGYSDAFRIFSKEKRSYTWWPNGFRIPDRLRGYRLDYFFVNEPARPLVLGSEILSGIEGSDHCPVTLDLTV